MDGLEADGRTSYLNFRSNTPLSSSEPMSCLMPELDLTRMTNRLGSTGSSWPQ